MKRAILLTCVVMLSALVLPGCGKTEPIIDNTSPDTAAIVHITSGQSQAFSVTAHDPKGLSLTYAWTSTIGSLSATTGSSITLSASDQGDGVVKVIVSNAKGDTVTAEWDVRVAPAPPAALAPASLPDGISLTWNEVPGATKYHIYRGEAPESLVKVGESSANSYPDTTAVEGIEYCYEVTAVGLTESVRSNRVSAMVGTELPSYGGNYACNAGPWVVNESVVIGGSLTINDGARLYVHTPCQNAGETSLSVGGQFNVNGELHVLPGAAVNLTGATATTMFVNGLLNVQGTADRRATLAGTSGGFTVSLVQAAPASTIQYADVRGLRQQFMISSCSPLIEHSRFETLEGYNASLTLVHSGAVIRNNLFRGMGLYFEYTQEPGIEVSRNVFMGGKPPLMFQFGDDGTVDSSKFFSNVFRLADDATAASTTNCDIRVVDNSSSVTVTAPLGSNYYFRGSEVSDISSPITTLAGFFLYNASAHYEAGGLLNALPDNAGPSWDDWTLYLD